jgi:hypothetical protein
MLEITVGCRVDNSQGRRVRLDAVGPDSDLGRVLAAANPDAESWFSLHCWARDYRTVENWESASGVLIDGDYFDAAGVHTAPPPETAEAMGYLLADGGVACSAWYATPHGCRVIFLFREQVADARLYRAAVGGAVALVERAFGAAGLLGRIGRAGYTVDRSALDLAHIFFVPCCRRRDEAEPRRSGLVLGAAEAPFEPAELARLTTEPAPKVAADEAFGPIHEGARNNTLFRLGCSMRAHGFTAEAILAALMAENAGHCAPPLGADEVAQIAASVARYEPGAARTGDAGRAAKLSFHTADEIASLPDAKVTWIVPSWVAAGSITEITGKAKTAGKTTFVLSAVASILRGEPFLGQATQRVRVVYLSEERPATFRVALKRAGLLGAKDLHVLFWGNAVGVPWSEVVARAAQQQDGPGVLVVDTVGQFSGMTGDQENSSAAALEVLAPLQEVAAQGHAVIVVRHERKGGGAVGEAGRGSSAYTGAADIVVSIRRLEGRAPLTRRVLHALSRFDETPETLVIERTADGFKSCGDETAVTMLDAERAILDTVAGCEQVGIKALVDQTGICKTTLQAATKTLVAAGRLTKAGTGHKGSPYVFSATGDPPRAVVRPNRIRQGEESPSQRKRDSAGTRYCSTAESNDAGRIPVLASFDYVPLPAECYRAQSLGRLYRARGQT